MPQMQNQKIRLFQFTGLAYMLWISFFAHVLTIFIHNFCLADGDVQSGADPGFGAQVERRRGDSINQSINF